MDYSLLNGMNHGKTLSAADKQMLFQERMSSTAHVREVEDLKAAGLNPVLSAGGNGAAVMSGALDQTMDQEQYNPVPDLIGTINNALKTTAKSLKDSTEAMKDAMNNQSLASAFDKLNASGEYNKVSTGNGKLDAFINGYNYLVGSDLRNDAKYLLGIGNKYGLSDSELRALEDFNAIYAVPYAGANQAPLPIQNRRDKEVMEMIENIQNSGNTAKQSKKEKESFWSKIGTYFSGYYDSDKNAYYDKSGRRYK